jgi:hypothetical protein
MEPSGVVCSHQIKKKKKKLANNAEHDPSAARREPSKTVQPSAKVLNSYKL